VLDDRRIEIGDFNRLVHCATLRDERSLCCEEHSPLH
jgi:hypothetical protein